jgi:hypothetical protein
VLSFLPVFPTCCFEIWELALALDCPVILLASWKQHGKRVAGIPGCGFALSSFVRKLKMEQLLM